MVKIKKIVGVLAILITIAGVSLGLDLAVRDYAYAVADELENTNSVTDVHVEKVRDFIYKIEATQIEGLDDNNHGLLKDLKIVKKQMMITANPFQQD